MQWYYTVQKSWARNYSNKTILSLGDSTKTSINVEGVIPTPLFVFLKVVVIVFA